MWVGNEADELRDGWRKNDYRCRVRYTAIGLLTELNIFNKYKITARTSP